MFTFYVQRENKWEELPPRFQSWMQDADEIATKCQVKVCFQEGGYELDGVPVRYDVNADRTTPQVIRMLFFANGEKAQVAKTDTGNPPLDH